MKKSTILFPLSLVLLFGSNHAFASATVDGDEDLVTGAATPPPTPVEGVFDPRDTNQSGHVSLKEKLIAALDLNEDGELNLKDVTHLPEHVWAKLKVIFDTNGNGKLEFDEIFSGTQEALARIDTLTGRVLLLSDTIQNSAYFSLIPANVKGSLENLFALVDQAAQEAKDGVNIGKSYASNIEGALTDLKPLLADLFKGLGDNISAEQKGEVKKNIFAYLEMVKGWDSTGENTKVVNSLEKKLAKA